MATEPRAPSRHARLRQLAITGVFIVGTATIAATSPAHTVVDIPARIGSFQLDANHRTALTSIAIRINAEATSGSLRSNLTVRVNSVKSAGADAASPGADAASPVADARSQGAAAGVRVLVTSAAPGVIPTPEPSIFQPLPVPTPWQAPLSVGDEISLPIQCGIGPCERAFWLIAQLTDQQAGAVTVEWSVGGGLEYQAAAWPSGAGAIIELGEPILVAGPVAQLAAATDVERVTLGPSIPAIARIVEVRIGPEAIPEHGSPLGTLSLDFIGIQPSPLPATAVYPLDSGNAEPPPTSPPGADPFAGCQPGSACTRRFLVTMAWTGFDKDQQLDWQLTVRRVDLMRVWSTPAELSATVERRFDVAAGSGSIIHREGENDALGPQSAPHLQLTLTTSTTADETLAPLLPVPAVLRYRAEMVDPIPPPSADVARVQSTIYQPIPAESSKSFGIGLGSGPREIVASAMAAQSSVCRINEACPDLEIYTNVTQVGRATSSPPSVRFRWSLGLTTYSYTDVPITVSAGDR